MAALRVAERELLDLLNERELMSADEVCDIQWHWGWGVEVIVLDADLEQISMGLLDYEQIEIITTNHTLKVLREEFGIDTDMQGLDEICNNGGLNV